MNVRLRIPRTDADQELLELLIERCGTEGGVDPYARQEDMAFWLIEFESSRNDTSGNAYWDPAGYTAISNIDHVARRCRGALYIDPDYRGNGLGEEALKKRNAMLFDDLNMHRIEWVVPADNEARLHIAEKMGQKQEGILRQAAWWGGKYHDLVCFATLKDEREGY